MKQNLLVIAITAMLIGSHSNGHAQFAQTAYGDFNGDGALDRVVSKPYAGDGSGRLYFFRGGDPGDYHENIRTITQKGVSIHDTAFPTKDDPPIDPIHDLEWGAEDVDAALSGQPVVLGRSLAVGDFDGDNFDDIAIGMHHARVNGVGKAGQVVVYYGYASGATIFPDGSRKQVIHQDTQGSWDRPHAYDGFGFSMAAGDFNCDGIDDLAIGTPFEDLGGKPDVGVVELLYGANPTGLRNSGDHLAVVATANNDVEGQRDDRFGYSLAAGRFNNERANSNPCFSLAVGAPRRDVAGKEDAGAVYIFNALANDRLRSGRATVITRNDIDDFTPDDRDGFGLALGLLGENVAHPFTPFLFSQARDGLWISVPGDKTGLCENVYETETFYHRLRPGATAIDPGNDDAYCGVFPPSVVEQRGRIAEVATHYGDVAVYVPNTTTAIHGLGLTLLIHGTCAGPDEPDPCQPYNMDYIRWAGWTKEADTAGEIVVSPAVDDRYFGCSLACGDEDEGGGYPEVVGGGYRATFGKEIGFDEWINYLVDELHKVGVNTNGQFRLYGHSGGGQFVSRYLWKHPERIISAVIESAWDYLSGLLDRPWPDGMQPFPGSSDTEWNVPPYDPASEGDIEDHWKTVVQRPIYVMVGEHDGLDNPGDEFVPGRRIPPYNTYVANQYFIRPVHSGKCLQVKDEEDRTPTQQWDCRDEDNFKFYFTSAGDGYWIRPKQSRKCWHVRRASTANLAPIWQWSCHPDNHFQFALLREQTGFFGNDYVYKIRAQHSMKCLHISEGSKDNGAPLFQWRDCKSRDDHLLFRLQIATDTDFREPSYCTRLNNAKRWVEDLNEFAANSSSALDVGLCFLQGQGHGSGGLHTYSADQLFNGNHSGPCVNRPVRKCLDPDVFKVP